MLRIPRLEDINKYYFHLTSLCLCCNHQQLMRMSTLTHEMDHILLDVALEVAKYLTPRDLSSCCAVSPHWRQVFGTNQTWKQLCDSEIEEHLRSTPCVVTPPFTLPDQDDSSLPPVSQWRAAFLREQHLWKNWRNGKFKVVEQKLEGEKVSVEQFISNDLIVVFYADSLQLWDIKANPPCKKDTFLFDEKTQYSPISIVSKTGIVVLKSYSGEFIKVFKVDTRQGSIIFKWQIQLNEQDFPKLVSCINPVNDPPSLDCFDIKITLGERCVGYFSFIERKNYFCVWDLKSGTELKKESCPTNYPEGGLTIVGCKSGYEICDDVIVLVPNSVKSHTSGATLVIMECQVYDTRQLKFLPFKQSFSVVAECLMSESSVFSLCAMTDSFVAFSDCGNTIISTIQIFNYRTGHQLCELEANSYSEVISDSCFLFTRLTNFQKNKSVNTISSRLTFLEEEDEKVGLCSVSCLSGRVIEDIVGRNVLHFNVVGKGFVEVTLTIRDSEVWRVDQFSCFKTCVRYPGYKESNPACTKLISYRNIKEGSTISITHFW